jgi:hypothetical protein
VKRDGILCGFSSSGNRSMYNKSEYQRSSLRKSLSGDWALGVIGVEFLRG